MIALLLSILSSFLVGNALACQDNHRYYLILLKLQASMTYVHSPTIVN
jgi:hypothetical protein